MSLALNAMKLRFDSMATAEFHTCEDVREIAEEEQEVLWLWYPYIPFGKITIIQGDPGKGKTHFILAVASARRHFLCPTNALNRLSKKQGQSC